MRRRPTITSTRELRASLSTSSVALDGERSGADDDSAEVTSGEVLQIELRADYAFTPQVSKLISLCGFADSSCSTSPLSRHLPLSLLLHYAHSVTSFLLPDARSVYRVPGNDRGPVGLGPLQSPAFPADVAAGRSAVPRRPA